MMGGGTMGRGGGGTIECTGAGGHVECTGEVAISYVLVTSRGYMWSLCEEGVSLGKRQVVQYGRPQAG